MKLKHILIYTSALSVAVSCSNPEHNDQPVPGQVVLAAPNGSEIFTDGDEIGFYLTTADNEGTQALAAERVHTNVKFVRIGEQFLSNPAIYFPEKTGAFNDLYAYSPWQENFIPAGQTAAGVGVASDQTENPGQNDFRYASLLDYQARSERAPLNFKHAFAKVNIRVAPGGYYDNLDEIPNPRKVVVKGVKTSGQFDFETLAFTPGGTPQQITPYGTLVSEGSKLTGLGFIMPPQQIAAGEIFMELVMGDDVFYLKPDKGIEFKAGTVNTLTITLNADFAGVQVNAEVDIEEWKDGGDFDFDQSEVLPPSGETVSDIDGNEYKIIRIGKQYWMGSNLRTTKFNDGTPLIKITDIVAQWNAAQNKGAFVTYQYDQTDIEKFGLLYNRFAVEIDRICPEGWHIPSTTDWDAVAKALGGTMDEYHGWRNIASSMKSAEGWASGMNGTNTSGFNAYPAGYLYSTFDDDGNQLVRFYDKGNSAKFWSYTALSGASSFIRSLGANDPEDAMSRFLANNVNGYSIRCVHDF